MIVEDSLKMFGIIFFVVYCYVWI